MGVDMGSGQKSTCNDHRAVNLANADRHNLEATGVGGAACPRHGCWIPHTCVDFQKGEHQMNMDYALCHALQYNMEGIRRAIVLYDVNCQYSKHFRRRIDESPYLSLDGLLEILFGIGLFHVHGHQDSCFGRYAPTFIVGAGLVDGEILETLWAHLNLIAGSTRGMSTSARREMFDRHMNDSNWKKMVKAST